MIAMKTTPNMIARMMRASIETFFCDSVSRRMTGMKSAAFLPMRLTDGGCGTFGWRRARGAAPPRFAVPRTGFSASTSNSTPFPSSSSSPCSNS